jgi:hypothetical protein
MGTCISKQIGVWVTSQLQATRSGFYDVSDLTA